MSWTAARWASGRCSILFHLLVPGGRRQTLIASPVWSASAWSSVFQRRLRLPLEPPQSAARPGRGTRARAFVGLWCSSRSRSHGQPPGSSHQPRVRPRAPRRHCGVHVRRGHLRSPSRSIRARSNREAIGKLSTSRRRGGAAFEGRGRSGGRDPGARERRPPRGHRHAKSCTWSRRSIVCPSGFNVLVVWSTWASDVRSSRLRFAIWRAAFRVGALRADPPSPAAPSLRSLDPGGWFAPNPNCAAPEPANQRFGRVKFV